MELEGTGQIRMPTSLSPVNMLQELTVKRHQAHPVYKITTDGTTFCCTVTVIGATTTAEGFSKTASKKNAAIAALQMLGVDMSAFKHESVTSLAFNAVGRLSEICVQKCIVGPRFEQEECQTELHFIFSCMLDELKTLGYGSSKKEAKQASALAMLKLLEKNKSHTLDQDQTLSLGKICKDKESITCEKLGKNGETAAIEERSKSEEDLSFAYETLREQIVNFGLVDLEHLGSADSTANPQ